jgi:hypothetical protein
MVETVYIYDNGIITIRITTKNIYKTGKHLILAVLL